MRILIASPVPVDAIAGPATAIRELSASFSRTGDEVRVITFNAFERVLPLGVRHMCLFLRALIACGWAESVLLLDPASTGPSIVLAAHLRSRRSLLRVGGDFLWESYVERTGEQVLLSEFYATPRTFSLKERFIRSATRFTLSHVHVIAFTTAWQQSLWKIPYPLGQKSVVIAPVLPQVEPVPATGAVFLGAARDSRVKNGEALQTAWKHVHAAYPNAVLDTAPRTPEAYAEALRSCYAVVVPSLSEVSPNAVFEAIHFGKPFVAPIDTGVYEALHAIGSFVDTRDTSALGKAMVDLLDPVTYRKRCEQLAAFATTRTWEEVGKDFRNALVGGVR